MRAGGRQVSRACIQTTSVLVMASALCYLRRLRGELREVARQLAKTRALAKRHVQSLTQNLKASHPEVVITS